MNVKAKLSEFSQTTSMHGIAHIDSSTKVVLKLFWTLVVMAGIAICIWYIYSSVQAFLQYPVLVQTQINFDKLPFPAVTICNLNPIRQSKLDLVPKLKELLSVCTMSPDANATQTKPIDFCQNYNQKAATTNAAIAAAAAVTTSIG